MTKKNSWLTEQFRAASTEVQSWSSSKQTAMSNALKSIDKINDGKSTAVTSKYKTIKTE